MEVDGMVSLWVGSAISRGAFDEALLASFSPDGDFLGSPFSRGFGIDYYEDSLREAVYYPRPPGTFEGLLAGSSYSSKTVPRFRQSTAGLAPGANCVVLLYNYEYEGRRVDWRSDGVSLTFLGAVAYT